MRLIQLVTLSLPRNLDLLCSLPTLNNTTHITLSFETLERDVLFSLVR
jgi:hypothetical protein